MRIRQIIITMLAALSLTSCGDIIEPDGKWDPMVWKAEVKTTKRNDAYSVPATGGELIFSCKNYSKPWIADALTSEQLYSTPDEQLNYNTITAEWFKAEVKDNILTVTFDSNQTTEERPLKLTVTAGDIFYTFTFLQSASK